MQQDSNKKKGKGYRVRPAFARERLNGRTRRVCSILGLAAVFYVFETSAGDAGITETPPPHKCQDKPVPAGRLQQEESGSRDVSV